MLLALVTFLAGLLAFPAAVASADPRPVVPARTVRVGLYENPPKIYSDADGRPAGIFPELLEAIAAEEGWELVWVPGAWSEGLARLSSGELDLMPDVAYTPEREGDYSFNGIPVLESWSCVYAPRGESYGRIEDLDGRQVAVLEGSVQEATLRRSAAGLGIDCVLVPVATLDEGFRLASEGRVDAAAASRYYGDWSASDYGLVRTAVVFDAISLHFAAPTGEEDLLEAIDLHLEAWLDEPASPYYRAMQAGTPPPVSEPSPYLGWLLLAVVLLAASTIGMLGLLRWQVRRRTRELESSRRELEASVGRLRKTTRQAVDTMGRLVELRDPYTQGHQERVASLAVGIGRELGLDQDSLLVLELAGLVHDVGKMAVPAELLNRPGRLTEDEMRVIQGHPRRGRQALGEIDFGGPVAEAVLQHHERLDGTGYPDGISGEEMHPLARILAVADVAEAMSSHRPYRPALEPGEVVEELTGHPGRYDEDAVGACLRVLGLKRPSGVLGLSV